MRRSWQVFQIVPQCVRSAQQFAANERLSTNGIGLASMEAPWNSIVRERWKGTGYGYTFYRKTFEGCCIQLYTRRMHVWPITELQIINKRPVSTQVQAHQVENLINWLGLPSYPQDFFCQWHLNLERSHTSPVYIHCPAFICSKLAFSAYLRCLFRV